MVIIIRYLILIYTDTPPPLTWELRKPWSFIFNSSGQGLRNHFQLPPKYAPLTNSESFVLSNKNIIKKKIFFKYSNF